MVKTKDCQRKKKLFRHILIICNIEDPEGKRHHATIFIDEDGTIMPDFTLPARTIEKFSLTRTLNVTASLVGLASPNAV